MISKPTSILMTADTVGGVWTYALELTRALQPYGFEVHLALMGPPLTSAQRAEANSVSNLNLFKSNYKLEWMPECWSDVKRAGDWLLHLASRLRPDVVHLNGYAHANLVWNSPTLVVGHSCVLSWWQSVLCDMPPAEWQRYKREVTNGLCGAHLVVTPTRAMLRALETHYGRINNSKVIPNGRDLCRFRPGEKQNFILSAGRLWDPAKNIERLAELAPDLPWPVFVAGECQAPDRSGHTRTLHPQCHQLGPLSESELRHWFATASIYALPALYEPFGYTSLEAGMSGCALVLGDIDSLREVWDDAAVFVGPNDTAALKAALLRLIDDETYRREMARRARMRALQFTSKRMARNYVAAYAELRRQFQPLHQQARLVQCA